MQSLYVPRAKQGFTIVELLVVIVVIAILAAISVVAYNGIRDRAIESTLKHDVQSAQTQIETYRATNGSLPTTLANVNDNTGLKTSETTSIQYTPTGDTYCITATTSLSTKIVYNLNSSGGTIQPGACVGHSATGPVPANNGVTTTNTSGYYYAISNPVFDTAGNMYFADSGNNIINKITPSGVKSTYAGSNASGWVDGPAASARFFSPHGLAIDSAGVIYVADTSNNRIRKIATDGTVSTVAGNGTYASVDGTGASAQFAFPEGPVLDSSGNLYVSDRATRKIRKITSSGVVTTIAGSNAGYVDGTGSNAKLGEISFLAINPAGDIIAPDTTNNRIRKITPDGAVTTIAGSGVAATTDGTALSAEFNAPMGIAIDPAGTMYITERAGNVVRKMTSDGTVTVLAGSGIAGSANGTGTAAQFATPNGITITNSGVLYVTSYTSSSAAVIRKIE